MDLALAVAEYFQLNKEAARSISGEVGRAISAWRRQAGGPGFSVVDIGDYNYLMTLYSR